ncbi:carboxymuconolactone decarboxylase family protein [Streptomyces triticisoli]|uniref:carboxymuconolactone decarboxylase family protein n=1 Tax=Streptomyces triticisoli TaxID=2182797 RepID=UPI000DD90E36|nr:carboxymuconolactone decarboxylase family protein [Streptomyces triticisoli]
MSGPVSTAEAPAGRAGTGRLEPPCRTEAAKAVRKAVRRGARDAGPDRTLTEPVDIRALQINGCGPCPDVHVRAAVKVGESLGASPFCPPVVTPACPSRTNAPLWF